MTMQNGSPSGITKPGKRPAPSPAGRTPKHDLDAEAAVLSAALLHKPSLDLVVGMLKPEDFYSNANSIIYRAILELNMRGVEVDTVTTAAALRDSGRLQAVGGAAYLAQLADSTPSVTNVEDHCRIVLSHSEVRRVAALGHEVVAACYDEIGDPTEFIDRIQQSFYKIGDRIQITEPSRASEVMIDLWTEMANGGSAEMRGVKTGFRNIDEAPCAFHMKDTTVIAGRPGMGKSAFALCLAMNIARSAPDDQGKRSGVAFFTLEMSRKQMTTRMLSILMGVPAQEIALGRLTQVQWNQAAHASQDIQSLPLYLDDTPGLTIMQLRGKIRRMATMMEREGCALKAVFVDYLQLMRTETKSKSATREQEVSEISRGLKAIAMEFNIHLFAMSQLNRGVEKQSDPRPSLADLRESGSIEQDASNVLLLYRSDYYAGTKFETVPEPLRGTCEVIIAKQRAGATGAVYLRFYKGCTRFEDLPTDVVEQIRDHLHS